MISKKTDNVRSFLLKNNNSVKSLLPLRLVRVAKRFSSLSAANGQFMLFRSDTYKQYQPHELFKNQKVEDIAIARYFKQKKMRTDCLTGNRNLTCRMYETYNQAVQGFSKNFPAFFGNSLTFSLLFWLVSNFGFIAVYMYLGFEVFIIQIVMTIFMHIFTSIISKQLNFINVFLRIIAQISFINIIFVGFINTKLNKFKGKGRTIS